MRERLLPPDPDDLNGTSLQDRDLLIRLTAYLDTLETRIRAGQGWCVFNASRARSARIVNYLLVGLRGRMPPVSHSLMTWRDFALNAYVTEVALPHEEKADPEPDPDSVRGRERGIARRVSREAYWRALNVDVFILVDVAPAHPHEVAFLLSILESRLRLRLPVILTTPHMPDALQAALAAIEGAELDAWPRLWRPIYETSLIAL